MEEEYKISPEEEASAKIYAENIDKYFTEKQIEDPGPPDWVYEQLREKKKEYTQRDQEIWLAAYEIERLSRDEASRAYTDYVFKRISKLDMKDKHNQWLAAGSALFSIERRHGRHDYLLTTR